MGGRRRLEEGREEGIEVGGRCRRALVTPPPPLPPLHGSALPPFSAWLPQVQQVQKEYQDFMERVRSKAQTAIDTANRDYQVTGKHMSTWLP